MRGLLVAVAIVLAAPSARADVVRGPECPEGSRPRRAHGTQGSCVLDGCSSDVECGEGRVCKEVPLCVNSGTVTSKCGAGNVCAVGTCSKDKRCVSDTKGGTKCGCSAGSPGEAAVYLGAITLVVTFRRAAWGRRRAERRPP